jgi:hypothetical protein
MDYQAKIVASLTGDADTQSRRTVLLNGFVTALERGGVDEAVAVVTAPFAELDQTFAVKLAEL